MNASPCNDKSTYRNVFRTSLSLTSKVIQITHVVNRLARATTHGIAIKSQFYSSIFFERSPYWVRYVRRERFITLPLDEIPVLRLSSRVTRPIRILISCNLFKFQNDFALCISEITPPSWYRAWELRNLHPAVFVIFTPRALYIKNIFDYIIHRVPINVVFHWICLFNNGPRWLNCKTEMSK